RRPPLHSPSASVSKTDVVARAFVGARSGRACLAWHTTCSPSALVGGRMNNSRAVAATVVGAVIGGVMGYLFFTERGRSMRREFEPALDEFARELMTFRAT